MNKKGSCATVEPIRDVKKIAKMKKFLIDRNERDYLMFVMGINSGLRISDLLRLTVSDVAGKTEITVREQKTGKIKQFALSQTILDAVASYLKNSGLTDGYLFASRKGTGPITKQTAWQIINEAAHAAGITDNVGTHTMRKTFGYHALRQGVDIAFLMDCFNHSSPAVTKRYIGIQQDELNQKVYLNMNL